MGKKKNVFTLITLIVFFLSGTGILFAADKEVKIALIYPVTGPLAHQSEISVQGHELAAEMINNQGGIKSLGGAKIKYVIADTQYKPDILKSEVQRVVQLEKVAGILGSYDSGSTIMVSQEAKKYKVPMVSGVAAADPLTTSLAHPYFFRYGIKATLIARDMYETYMMELKKAGLDPKQHDKIALLYMDGKFGQAVAGGCKQWAPEYKLSIVADLPYPVGSTDLSGTMLKLRSAKPDAVFLGATLNDGILAAKSMKQFNINVLGWYAGGGGPSELKYYQSAPVEAEYHHAWTYWHHDLKQEKVKRIAAAYKERFNKELDGDSAMAFATTIIMADALERAGSMDREKLRTALAATDMEGTDERMPTTFGAKFDDKGQNIYVKGLLLQNLGGKRYTVYPEQYATNAGTFPIPEWNKR